MRTLFLALIVIVSSWAFLNPQFFYLHDFLHAARVAEMARGIQEGQSPVIWSANFGYGYGMPLFLFYAPLPYFIGALFFLVGLPIVQVVQLLFIVSSIVCVVASYKLVQELWGSEAGLVGAALMTLAPYRAVNLFVRGALSESWGLSAALVALLGVVYSVRNKRGGFVLTWLGCSALFISHNLSALIFIPFIALFGVLFAFVERKSLGSFGKRFGMLLLSIGASVGTTLFYTLPALAEKDATRISSILTGYFDYHLHFVYVRQFFSPFWGYGGSSWGPDDGISFFLGWPQLLLLGLACIWLCGQFFFRKKVQKGSVALFGLSGALLLVALWFTTAHSLFFWETIPLFPIIQFPWRFLAPALVFVAIAACAAVLGIPAKQRKVVIYAFVVGICAVQWYMFKPEHFGGVNEKFYYSDAERIRTEASSTLPDFIPNTLTVPLEEPKADLLCQPEANCARISVVQKKAHEWILSNQASTTTTVTASIADFAGWRVFSGTQEVPKIATDSGLIMFAANPEEKEYRISFGMTPLRQAADMISICSTAGVLAGLVVLRKKQT